MTLIFTYYRLVLWVYTNIQLVKNSCAGEAIKISPAYCCALVRAPVVLSSFAHIAAMFTRTAILDKLYIYIFTFDKRNIMPKIKIPKPALTQH